MIYLNNSSLEYLGCTRRYVYQVVHGAVVPKEQPLAIGTLFHAYMRDITPGENGFTFAGPFSTTRYAEEKAQVVDPNLHLILGDIAAQVAAKLGYDNLVERELFFEHLIEVSIDDTPAQVTVCGTTDLRSYLHPYATITDYKTTKHKVTADHIINYQLKSQLFFYGAAFKMIVDAGGSVSTNAQFNDAVRAGLIARRYIHASYTERAATICDVEPIPPDALVEFKQTIYEKAHLAAYLHKYPERSTKDGMTTGGCYFCPFKPICKLHNPILEAREFKSWPYGFAQYNPRHYDI